MVDLSSLFADFIGNADAIEALKYEIEGARRRGAKLSHILMTGHAGTGKTTLSRLVATAMDAVFLDIDCATLEGMSLEDVLGFGQGNKVPIRLTSGKYDMEALPSIILWDESHLMDKNKHQSALLKPMLDKLITLKDGTRVDVSNITHIFATTDADLMLRPLKERCETVVHLERYSNEELARIISSFRIEDQEIVDGVMRRRWYRVGFPHPSGSSTI